jgi:branched-subunit amino acid transport protein
MSLWVVIALAALTYGSRAAALVFLPEPTGRIEQILGRIPAPLFAGLGVLSLVTPERALAPVPVLAAACGALAASPRRSLALCLVAGLGAYGVAALLTAG